MALRLDTDTLENDLENYRRFLAQNPAGKEGENSSIHWAKAKKTTFTLFSVLMDKDLIELVSVLESYPDYIPLVCEHFRYSYNYSETEADIVATSRLLAMGEPYMTNQFARNVLQKLPKLEDADIDEVKRWLDKMESIQEELHRLVLAHYSVYIEQWMERRGMHALQQITIKKRLDKLSPDRHERYEQVRNDGVYIPYLA